MLYEKGRSGTSYTLQTTAGFHALTFQGLDPDGGDNTAFIDDVALNVTV